jgi:single-stranded-DNA-specific exonuclease
MLKKRWEFLPVDAQKAEELQKELKINPIFCQLLVQRGISTFEDAKKFFRPQFSDLYDPFLMQDMHRAVRRIERAIIADEQILIYGDYDVDGTTSVALMFSFLSNYYDKIDYYLPDRYKEGYGVSLEGVQSAHKQGVTLIIALDCGINAHTQIDTAKKLGIDFIICDHHLPDAGKSLPDAIILNPKRPDCAYPYKELSGCGIGFKLAQAFSVHNQLPEAHLHALLDLVAVSIACDLVDLTGENRILTHFGLERFNQNPRFGFKALKELLQNSPEPLHFGIHQLVFRVGPVINAAGRIEHAKEAVELLLAEDKATGTLFAQKLLSKNQTRRDIEADITQQALDLAAARPDFKTLKSTVLFSPDWHKGVIGIVASKMVEEFYRPTIVFSQSEDGLVVGSARSVEDFDIYAAIQHCSDLLVKFGGHVHAAGLSLKLENLEAFAQKFEQYVSENLTEKSKIPTIFIGSELELSQITDKFWGILRQFAPFGPGNMRPVFLSKNVHDTGYSKTVKEVHLKLSLRQDNSEIVEGIGFGYAHLHEQIKTRRPFHLVYVVDENTYQQKTTLQLQVKDILV